MKVYLAAQFSRREELKGYQNELEDIGIEITARWLWEESDQESHYQLYAFHDLQDITECNFFILFSGEPYLGSAAEIARGGRHYETGYAQALGKKIIIVGPRENIFHYNPYTKRFNAWPACKLYLEEYAAKYN